MTKLRLNTDFSELLPASDPAVEVLKEMNRRMAGLSSLDVVVQGPDGEANRRFASALVPRLLALHDPVIDDVTDGVEVEDAFFSHNEYLYATSADLTSARDRLEHQIALRKNPLLADLDDDGPGDGFAEIEKSLAGKTSPFAKFPGGHFAYKDGSLYAVVIWLRGGFLGDGPANATAERIRATATRLAGELNNQGQKVGLTGNVITAAEERGALANDLTVATTLSVVAVCIVVFLFFGRLSSVPFMVVPALIGVLLALGFAQLAFGFLNTATGFMGAIIVGNGINYAIVQMARYEEERRRGRSVGDAVGVALETTWRATGLAAVGAAIAYGSLAITDFRGFNQFGYIGGAGMLLSWFATLLVLPCLWVLFDRRAAGATVPRVRGFSAAAPIARFTIRHARGVLLAGLAVSIVAALPLPRFVRDPFEYDFDKLRNQVAKNSDSEVLSAKLNPIFGRSLSPSFVLADRPEQVEAIRKKMLERDRTRHVIGEIKTVTDFLPGTPEEQSAKLVLLGQIRALLDKNLDLLEGDERASALKMRPPDDLRVLSPPDLPRGVRRFYTEADGTIGRMVAWFPRDDINVWDGRVQRKLAEIVRDVKLDDGTLIRSSGWAVVFAAMIDAVTHDGPKVTAVSFFGVLGLLLLLAQRRGAWLVVGSLCVGVLWMVGATAAAGVRINFLNFIALPITFGIAVDYGANIYLRYRLEGPGGLERSVTATGGAVALCSLTTIIGYGALLVADTQGLRTFGAAAILGEFACITTALVLLPAAIELLERRARAHSPTVEKGKAA